jgi:putative ABC transport system permease protein
MRHFFRLAAASAWNRRSTLALTVVSIALSVAMLLGVARARVSAQEGFAQSVSGTDLVVGARTSPVQLVLFAVFHLGDAMNEIRYASYEAVAADPAVAWAVPLALGDSHRGFAVLGATAAYFERFRHGRQQSLRFSDGRAFAGTLDGVFEAVIGAEVARSLNYGIGQRITLSHGRGGFGADRDPALPEHADKPFTVVGILEPSGTPVDRTVHVSLEAIEAIHLDWQAGAPLPGLSIPAGMVRKFDLRPRQVTAVLVGLKSRSAVFRVQRCIDHFGGEPLMAVLPGIALDQLWQVVGLVESALLAVAALVVVVGLAGMVAVVLASLGERRRELAVLRSVGAGTRHIAALLIAESLAVTVAGAVLGAAGLALIAALAGEAIERRFGLVFPAGITGVQEWQLLCGVWVAGLLGGIVPAWRACRISLADGLTPRL